MHKALCDTPVLVLPYSFSLIPIHFPGSELPVVSKCIMLILLPRMVFLGVSAWEIPFPALKISHPLIQEGFPGPLSPALRVDTPSSRCVCLCRAFTLQHCLLLFTHCRPVSVSSGSSSMPGTLLVPQQCLFEWNWNHLYMSPVGEPEQRSLAPFCRWGNQVSERLSDGHWVLQQMHDRGGSQVPPISKGRVLCSSSWAGLLLGPPEPFPSPAA